MGVQIGYNMEKRSAVFPFTCKKIFDRVAFYRFDTQTFPDAGIIGKLYTEPPAAEIIL